MKRTDAIRKLMTLCSRLDQASGKPGENFGIDPLYLWLFGSVLTDKENPDDIDLVIQVDSTEATDSENKLNEILYCLSYSKPLPWERAVRTWCTGMKMFRPIIIEKREADFSDWILHHTLLAETEKRLIWEPGFDWENILSNIRNQPLEWNRQEEARRKSYNLVAKQVLIDKGNAGLDEWRNEHPFEKWEL
jgi:hypothetical protein